MTEIANDMAYGYGTEHQGTIYADTDTLADYKREYQLNGFDPVAHALFSNAADFDVRALLEETPSETSVYSSSPADNTRVERRNPVELENARIADFNRNRKAVYTRQEMYKAVYRLPIGETEWSIPISTGLDI